QGWVTWLREPAPCQQGFSSWLSHSGNQDSFCTIHTTYLLQSKIKFSLLKHLLSPNNATIK
ncbi:hypothetical protein, partial [Kistimonas scapharcae]|uniref:hypothetical protein n=1 Tax=Kistimonas scapharcae TaxID=1036133 RepID=UPI0031E92799